MQLIEPHGRPCDEGGPCSEHSPAAGCQYSPKTLSQAALQSGVGTHDRSKDSRTSSDNGCGGSGEGGRAGSMNGAPAEAANVGNAHWPPTSAGLRPPLPCSLVKPLLRRFDDASEQCREVAAWCALELLRRAPDEALALLPYVVPVLEERLQRRVRCVNASYRRVGPWMKSPTWQI
jgi:hypothetical protein